MICDLCQKEINTKEERYTHVEDWEKEKRIKEMWVHVVCFRKAMNRNLTELERQAKEMLSRAGSVFNKIAPLEEEYSIK